MRWPLFRPTPLEDLLRRYSDFDRRPGRIPIVEVTGDETPLYICQHRHFLRTVRHRVRAARVEAAAGRRVERAGHLAGEDDLLAPLVGMARQRRRKQRLRIGMLGRAGERPGLSGL